VIELVRRAGGRVITDESPNGGRHLYVPFGAPLGFHEARDLALALATRTPTMDPSPNQNLSDGLIRPPGSVHPSGGHQILHGPLATAFDLASTGNPPVVLGNLRTLLATELAAVTARQQTSAGGGTDEIAQAGHLPRPSGARELAPDYLRIATTGLYDTARYRSPSEARQAVLDAAVWAGLTLPAVLARIENGTWPGLSAFYTRYRRPGTRRTAILADWRKALAYVTDQQAKNPTQTLVRKSPTSEPPSHGGAPMTIDQDQQRTRGTPGEYQWIRSWWTALGLLEHTRYPGRAGHGKRWVLRALGEAAMKTGSRYIAFGVRSLSVATGMDHTTVAAHLRALRDEDDPLIDLIENDRGLAGDLYQLRIPDDTVVRATTLSWKAGKLHALRPVFRELGHPAAFVYEALEHHKSPQRSFDLTASTGLSRTAVYEALETLAAWNLVSPTGDGRWGVVAGTSLQVLAEQFGCADTVRALVNRHRDERTRYRKALKVVDQYHIPVLAPADHYHWPPEPPPQHETLMELLERELGAHLVGA
jgi:hypothetical protein